MQLKKRLDLILVEKNLFKSRNEAQKAIFAKMVLVNEQLETKPGKMFSVDKIKDIKIKEFPKYVSRGGYKLQKALDEFKIDVSEKICLDIGASTGGFTDCLLQYNAKKVYAVDVGYGQLDLKIRNNPKVVPIEKTNIRYIDKTLFKEKIDIVTIDVSFISIKKFVLNLLDILNKDFAIIILIKPQFEANIEEVKKGVVKDKAVHKMILLDFLKFFNQNNLKIVNLTYSPIRGPKGNIEFLAEIREKGEEIREEFIERVVNEAWLKFGIKEKS
jgi:23S rRNA (cytidine1920-2'-O)/16S rRNA (cytidine1409-2'-O)-methyltransferase